MNRLALRSAEELTPGWCSAALAPRIGSARVVGTALTPLGTGQVADAFRLRLSYEPPGAGPASCVAKLTSASAASRAAAKVTRAYEAEVGFYRELAPTLPVRRPACYHACYDAETGAFALLLEDRATARQIDQVVGCDEEEITGAVTELAALHGPRWGDPALAGVRWLPRHDGPGAARMASLARTVRGRFLRHFGDRLVPEVACLVDRFVPTVARYLRDRRGPRTLVHGDFRADNLLFEERRVTVLDWQTVAHEPGVTDLAYLLGASVPTGLRRRVERDLVRHYADALHGHGAELSPEDCWTEYRRYALGGLLMTIVGSSLVPHTERGDEMFVTMANRHGIHALDLEATSFLC